MVGEYGDVLFTSRLYLQHEGLHGGLSTEGERSSMVEDAPATIEHGRRRRVMGTVRGTVPERYLSEEFIECQLNEFNALRQGGRMVPEYEAHFMELLRYAPHLNTEKLKVNKFVFGLNVSIRAKVRILMPQTLHDVVQKALIAEEELISGGQRRTPARPVGQVSSGAQQHQTPARHSPGYRGFQRGSTFTTPR
jgi:hypothetical protein